MHSIRDKNDPRGNNIQPNADALALQGDVPLSDEDKLFGTPTVDSPRLATGYVAPCPFCGGKAKYNYADCGGKYIECTKCGVATRLHYDRAENLDSSWNTRHEIGSTCCSKCTVPESRCPRIND